MPSLYETLRQWDLRFANAMASLPERRPWVAAERASIREAAARSLRLRNEWIPQLHPQSAGTTLHNGFRIEKLRFTSWPGCHGAAHLYLPEGGPSPLVLIACGHGPGGKQNRGYQLMGEHLARSGIAALVSDNIGQGERAPMGHQKVPGVFAAGLTLQGLIVMETLAWLHWARAQPQFDAARIGMAGNSGGGTLTLFTSALCEEPLAAVACSGYPSTFEFIARKEKEHCHCNLLEGIVGELEMWQILGTLAPRPLFLFQGSEDPLFPIDLFRQTAARTADAYFEAGSPETLRTALFEGGHPWDGPRRQALTSFFCETLLGTPLREGAFCEPSPEPPADPCFTEWPAQALTAEALASQLGQPGTANRLSDLYPSHLLGENRLLRGDPAEICAQFAIFLGKISQNRAPFGKLRAHSCHE